MLENSYLMQIYGINISQVMMLRLYTVYNMYEIVKIVNQTKGKSQVLSQVLE